MLDMSRIVDATAPLLAALYPGARAQRSAVFWRPGVLVTSEQGLPGAAEAPVVLPGGARATARLAGRDPGTNVAAFRVEADGPAPASVSGATQASPPGAAPEPAQDPARRAAAGPALPPPSEPRVGAFALVLGADAEGGPTARLGVVHRVGPAWDSMAGGRIDRLVRVDARLPAREEGGPVLDAAGGLLGMSTLGPRARVLAIPASTVERVLDPLLAGGGVARGWLGLGLQPVAVPAALRETAGRDAALMVVGLAPGGPAEAAGVLPGDLLLRVDEAAVTDLRAVAAALADRVGQDVALHLLRGGAPVRLTARVAARPRP